MGLKLAPACGTLCKRTNRKEDAWQNLVEWAVPALTMLDAFRQRRSIKVDAHGIRSGFSRFLNPCKFNLEGGNKGGHYWTASPTALVFMRLSPAGMDV
jgi:hypothetical protein